MPREKPGNPAKGGPGRKESGTGKGATGAPTRSTSSPHARPGKTTPGGGQPGTPRGR